MDEGIVIEHDGRVVGVAVRVRGGFMFFSPDPDLRVLEGNVFGRAEMVTRRVAEVVRAMRISNKRSAVAHPSWSASAIDSGGGNVVRLRPRQRHKNADPEPPDAA